MNQSTVNYKALFAYIVTAIFTIAIPLGAGFLYPYIKNMPEYTLWILGISGVVIWIFNVIILGVWWYHAYKKPLNS